MAKERTSLFEHNDYKVFYLEYLKGLPKKGYGQFRKLAQLLNVSPVIITQIFKGDRNLNSEQALECSDYFGFSKLESKYFLLLVQKERAGTHRLKKTISEELREIRVQSQEIKNRIPKAKSLSDEGKALYYSGWYYSGVRLFSDIGKGVRVEEIAEHFQLPMSAVRRIIEFLLQQGLCEEKEGLISRSSTSTHLEAQNPLVARHHQNWRLKGFQHMEDLSDKELFFTGPMVLSEQTIAEIRQELVSTISRVTKKTESSKSEALACLNIDWFRY